MPGRPPRLPAGGLVVLATFAALALFERRRPLRRSVESGWRREARNLVLAAAAATAFRLAEKPVVGALAERVARRRWGLLQRWPLPPAVEAAAALVLLDYTLYLWHVLLHRVPLLWRCHLPHHVDLDLTVSTGLRFHAAELVLSVPWRAAQVVLLGVRPPVLALWQNAALAEILFHHANLCLPRRLDAWLARAVVTPRLHGIHHSTVREETASNLSSGLVLWDWLHGTLMTEVPQRAIAIGVPAYRDPDELRLAATARLPFVAQRPAWRPDYPVSWRNRLGNSSPRLSRTG